MQKFNRRCRRYRQLPAARAHRHPPRLLHSQTQAAACSPPWGPRGSAPPTGMRCCCSHLTWSARYVGWRAAPGLTEAVQPSSAGAGLTVALLWPDPHHTAGGSLPAGAARHFAGGAAAITHCMGREVVKMSADAAWLCRPARSRWELDHQAAFIKRNHMLLSPTSELGLSFVVAPLLLFVCHTAGSRSQPVGLCRPSRPSDPG